MSIIPDDHSVDDVRVRSLQELTRPVDLLRTLPASGEIRRCIFGVRGEISRILHGLDPRLLVVVGPCSIHHADAALEYARWLLQMSEAFRERLRIVMRVYFEKPRTRGGWKGLINDPYLDGSFRINDGLRLARHLLLEINHIGIPTATEYVDPITPQYTADLISWAAIGARTAESQVHRELASGLSCPVGFKNSTSGDMTVAVNAIVSARSPHHFLGVTKIGTAAIVATTGNPDCHIILRGGVRPNYDEASIAAASALLTAHAAVPRLMVDCSHGNCEGDYHRQLLVAAEVARQRASGLPLVCGLMVESNLVGGVQTITADRPLLRGVSVTDPCLGLDETAALLSTLAGSHAAIHA